MSKDSAGALAEESLLAGPPGMACASTNGSNGHSSAVLHQDVEQKVSERVNSLWEKGRKAMAQASMKHEQQLMHLTDEVSRCNDRQKALEEENEQLKKVLHNLADRFSALGAFFQVPPVVIDTGKPAASTAPLNAPPAGSPSSPPPKAEDVSMKGETKEDTAKLWSVDATARKRSWLSPGGEAPSTATTATPASSNLADLLTPSPLPSMAGGFGGVPLPTIPDFPFPGKEAEPTAAPCTAPSTPFSLADALGPPAAAGASPVPSPAPSAPTPLSLAASLPQAAAPVAPPGLDQAATTTMPANTTPILTEQMLNLYGLAAGFGTRGYHTFSFTLRRADDVELGLTVSPTDDGKALRVEAIREDGAVESWNRQCANNLSRMDKVVASGDLIVGVNDMSLNADGMLLYCKEKQLLKISILRGHLSEEELVKLYEREAASAESAATSGNGNGPSTMRAEAATFVPMGMAASSPVPTSNKAAGEGKGKEDGRSATETPADTTAAAGA
eukprot:TRINITY_DN7331_c0_g1_i3.p1 TRINITY_DN7331_c0_g1~~TRINITY_DN7331_c0_g1_i3.p1  ORF type:complete len:502 (-),score=132.20 TRINITY_DN7331_c0_g1_i3:74-1579(-)